MSEQHLAKVNSNSKSKEKIQLSKWREQACFWRQNSNYHSKWREQACFSMFSRWRQISNSNRMRNICRNGARSEADLAECGALALPPPFLFLWLLVHFFFNAPLWYYTNNNSKRLHLFCLLVNDVFMWVCVSFQRWYGMHVRFAWEHAGDRTRDSERDQLTQRAGAVAIGKSVELSGDDLQE